MYIHVNVYRFNPMQSYHRMALQAIKMKEYEEILKLKSKQTISALYTCTYGVHVNFTCTLLYLYHSNQCYIQKSCQGG